MASPRGGTANYSMLYVLLSILRNSEVSRVIEFGAGSSSRLISQWNQDGEGQSVHIEDDPEWLRRTLTDAPNRTLVHAPLVPVEVAGRTIDWYEAEKPEGKFQLVSIDGPQAWSKQRQFNRLGVLSWIPEILDKDFVIVTDDTSRKGEGLLASLLGGTLKEAGIDASAATYAGADSQVVFATPKFADALYL